MTIQAKAPFSGVAIAQPNIEHPQRAPEPEMSAQSQMGDNHAPVGQMGDASWTHPLRRTMPPTVTIQQLYSI